MERRLEHVMRIESRELIQPRQRQFQHHRRRRLLFEPAGERRRLRLRADNRQRVIGVFHDQRRRDRRYQPRRQHASRDDAFQQPCKAPRGE